MAAGLVRPPAQERPVGQRGPGGDRPDRAVPSARVARRDGRGRPRRRDRLPAVPDHPGRVATHHGRRRRAGRRTAGRDGGARARRPGRTPPPAWRPPRGPSPEDEEPGRAVEGLAPASAPRRGTGASCPLVAGCPRSGRVGGLEVAAARSATARSARSSAASSVGGAAQRHRGRRSPTPPSRAGSTRRSPGSASTVAGASAAQARRSGSRSPVRSSGTAQPRTSAGQERVVAGRPGVLEGLRGEIVRRGPLGRPDVEPGPVGRPPVELAVEPRAQQRRHRDVPVAGVERRRARSRARAARGHGRASSRPVSSAASDGGTAVATLRSSRNVRSPSESPPRTSSRR